MALFFFCRLDARSLVGDEGLATLERARGETVALRNLANAAALMENHPAILNLRWMQTAGQAASGTGNTFVLGIPQVTIPLKETGK